MAKILFKLSDKTLLLKLHAAALKAIKFDKDGGFSADNKFAVVNSGLAEKGKSIDMLNDDQIGKLVQKDSSSIKYFCNKSGVYEVGVAALDAEVKAARSGGKAFHQKQFSQPGKAYEAFANDPDTDISKLDKLKKEAYKTLVDYMTSFCGKSYAKSIPKDKIQCEAYRSLDEVQVSENGLFGQKGVLGHQGKAIGSTEVKVLLFKIGYTIGAKKV